MRIEKVKIGGTQSDGEQVHSGFDQSRGQQERLPETRVSRSEFVFQRDPSFEDQCGACLRRADNVERLPCEKRSRIPRT